MATATTTALTFPMEQGLREALRTDAHQEHRSSADMMKIIGRATRATGRPYIRTREVTANNHTIAPQN